MTFRADQFEDHSFEVRDISFSGMQISLKDGDHQKSVGDEITGVLMWAAKLKIKGKIRWCDRARIAQCSILPTDSLKSSKLFKYGYSRKEDETTSYGHL